jgi:menaquinone-9 beta-reductase
VSEWDAIVCGGSFGGLAAAGQIGGRVLVIDRLEIGEGETSASAVPLACLERLDLVHHAQQVHRDIVLHVGDRVHTMRLFDFATFDYRALCREMFARSGAEFLRARVHSAGEGVVRSSAGEHRAPILVDAAGWRTAAPPEGRDGARAGRRSFGVEARQPFRGEGLHFYVGPAHGRRMFSWVFPAGDHVRAGLAAYDGRSSLSGDLERFLGRHGLGEAGRTHGGYFTSRFGEPVRDGVFVVGDAAGQCLPVSGEGIRPALVFGQLAGRLAERVRTGELGLDEALGRYRAYVMSRRRGYDALDRLQSALDRMPDAAFALLARAVGSRRLRPWAVRHYRDVADPGRLTPGPAREPLPEAAAISG